MTRPPTQFNIQRTMLRLWAKLLGAGLLVALLLSQSLGQLHIVKHGGSVGAHQASAAHATHGTQSAAGFFDALFSSHSTSSDCRLYDQLSGGVAMPAVAHLMVPVVLPSFVVAIFQGEALARWAALFDARGPPLTS